MGALLCLFAWHLACSLKQPMLGPVSCGKSKGNQCVVQCPFRGFPFFTPPLPHKVANQVADVISAAVRPDFFRVPPYRVCRHCHCACGVLLVVMLFVQFRVMAFPVVAQHLVQKALPDEAAQFIAELLFGQGVAPSKFLSCLCVRLLQFILCEHGLAGVGLLRPVDHRPAHVAVTDLGRFVGEGQLQSPVALVRDVECLERRIPRVQQPSACVGLLPPCPSGTPPKKGNGLRKEVVLPPLPFGHPP